MRLSNNLIEDVVSKVAGQDVIKLAKYLKNKKNISELKLADVVGKDINETRNMLYRLYHANLVSFVRRKDKVKGWYIYYWTFNPKRISHLSKRLKTERIERLKNRITKEEEGFFFKCDQGCVRLDFDQSTDFSFKCPECGRLLTQEEQGYKVNELRTELNRLEKELHA